MHKNNNQIQINMDTQLVALTADSSHFSSLIHLGSTYYPPEHPVLTKEYLNWLYLENPAGPATLIVAHENNLWIGLIVLIPVLLEYAGQVQKACYAVNVLTHPEHRGKNLFVKMIKHAREVLSNDQIWLLGHPNVNAIPGWKRQKMEFKDPLHLYLSKFSFPFSSICENHINNSMQLHAIPTVFWSDLAYRSDVHLKYTPEYITWRFINAPHRKYVVTILKKNNKILGLRITRPFKGPVDLLVDVVGQLGDFGYLLSHVRKPTLVMHPGLGSAKTMVDKACWKLPFKRQFPFFASKWDNQVDLDMTGITLAASDF